MAAVAPSRSPVIVSVAERSYWDGERLPNRIQVILDYFSLVADGEPRNRQSTAKLHQQLHVQVKHCPGQRCVAENAK